MCPVNLEQPSVVQWRPSKLFKLVSSSMLATALVFSLGGCQMGTPPAAAAGESGRGGPGVKLPLVGAPRQVDDVKSLKETEPLKRHHTIKSGGSIPRGAYEWSTEAGGATVIEGFWFETDGRFVQDKIVHKPDNGHSRWWHSRWWGSYRLNGKTLELVWRNGDRQRYPFKKTDGGIVIGPRTYKLYKGYGG